jgi:hypothetical protein
MFQGSVEINPDEMQSKMEHTKRVIEEVNQQFKNPVCLWMMETNVVGSYHLCLCLYTGIPFPL